MNCRKCLAFMDDGVCPYCRHEKITKGVAMKKQPQKLRLRKSIIWAIGFRIEVEYDKKRKIEKITMTRNPLVGIGNKLALGLLIQEMMKEI